MQSPMSAVKQLPIAMNQKRTWQLAASLGILLLALGLRIWNLGAESAWIDEAYSIALAKHPIAGIIQGTAADQHPPLYYLLLHFWLLFGSGVTYARSLSLIIGMINIAQIIEFGRRQAGVIIGLGAGLLLAISPMHVWYSQEVRMYILLAVLTTAASIELWACLQGRGRWVLYGLYAALSLYTHYFAAFIQLAQAVLVLAWVWRQRNGRILMKWGASMLAVGLVFAPWVPVALNQTRFHTMGWIAPPTAIEIVDTLLRLLFGSAVLVLPGMIRWILAVSIGVLLLLSFWWLRGEPPQYRWSYRYLSAWAFIPFITIAGIALIYPIFQFKQFLIILAPLLLWAVWLSRSIPRSWGLLPLAAIVVLSGASLVYQQVTLTKDDWRAISSYLEQNFLPGDMIYANPAASSLAFSLYWDESLPFEGYPPNYDIVSGGWEGVVLTPSLAAQELEKVAEGHDRIWLVEFFPQLWDPDETLPGWLNQHGQLLEDRNFGNIHLRLYQLTPK